MNVITKVLQYRYLQKESHFKICHLMIRYISILIFLCISLNVLHIKNVSNKRCEMNDPMFVVMYQLSARSAMFKKSYQVGVGFELSMIRVNPYIWQIRGQNLDGCITLSVGNYKSLSQ
jgi:hypothetical protein